MIDNQTVAKILDAAQIVDVVSDFVTLRKRGVNYVGLCPFHDEKTGSFTVSPAKGIYKCFGCGKAGNSVHFIMEHEHIDYPSALKYLAKKYHIEVIEKELSEEEKHAQSDRESMFALNEWAQNYFVNALHNTEEGRNIGLSYFRERGFSDEIIKKFGLGFAPNKANVMSVSAIEHGFKSDFIEKCGIGIRRENGGWYDRFHGRVIFPVHTISGKIVAFGGRILEKNDKSAKYVNSPESEIYHKSNELYGIYYAKQEIVKKDRCYLVEGYTDVISMHQAGILNVVASSGTSLTHGQIRLIHRFTSNITVLYDGDGAGIKASIRGIDMLLEEGLNVKVVLLPDGEDPDSYAKSNNASDFIRFIETNQVDFIRFKTKLLLDSTGNDPIKRAQLIQDVVQSISLIPDGVVRSVYTKECSAMLDIEEKILVDEINKRRNKKEINEAIKAGYNPNNGAKRVTHPAYRDNVVVNKPFLSDVNNGIKTNESSDLEDNPERIESNDNKLTNEYAAFTDNVMSERERSIMYYVVRDSEKQIRMCDSHGEIYETRVGQYIYDELTDLSVLRTECKTLLCNPIYDDMLREMIKNISSPDFKSSDYFKNHPNPNISIVAIDLLTDRYQLSKMFTKYDEYNGAPDDVKAIEEYNRHKEEAEHEKLVSQVTCVINEYKLMVMKSQEDDIKMRLKNADAHDVALIGSLIKDMQKIKEIIKQLSAVTGHRIIM